MYSKNIGGPQGNLTQTTLNSYFKSTNTNLTRPKKINFTIFKRRNATIKRTMNNSVAETSTQTMVSQEISSTRIKLVAPIFSDSEEENEIQFSIRNSASTLNPTREKTPERILPEENDLNITRDNSKRIKIMSNVSLSPSKSSTQQNKEEESPKSKKMNLHELSVMKEFCTTVMLDDNLKGLLSETDRNRLSTFLYMPKEYQYLVMKLFTWQPIWYNIFKYANTIGLAMNDEEIQKMYDTLKNNEFVLTDYLCEDLTTLLSLLDVSALKDMHKKFKMTGRPKNKSLTIAQLLKACETQSTLLPSKSMREVLKNAVKSKLGLCVKLSDDLRQFLFKIYLLNTFANPSFSRPREYFSSVGYLNLTFPQFNVDDYMVFCSQEEFDRYSEAVTIQNDIEKAFEQKNIGAVYEFCRLAFANLQKLVENKESIVLNRLPYLERFSAISKYISILSANTKHLTKLYYEDVKSWLIYFLQLDYAKHKRSFWYEQLSMIYTTYLKSYNQAAELIIQALEIEKNNFTERQLQNLAQRGKILNKKSFKVFSSHLEMIEALSPPPWDGEIPTITIDNRTIRDNISGQKRHYVHIDDDGVKHYCSVEEIARKHYLLSGFSNAEHYENMLMNVLFCLLFWDIIYETYVPGVFVSKVQTCPLDMYSKYFYLNRKEVIDKRLNEIRSEWDDLQLFTFLEDQFNQHAHESSICRVDTFVANSEVLLQIVSCIDRSLLSKILERMALNFKEHHSGLPDLFVWDVKTKKCKFVEVKGEGDRLSIKQILWLNYLLDHGADAEVCHVHSTGSKKRGSVTEL